MKNRSVFIAGLAALAFLAAPALSRADYSSEILDQIRETQSRFSSGVTPAYFHDMAIIARKADDAGLYDLNYKIISQYLFEPMEADVRKRVREINAKMPSDAYSAAVKIPELLRLERYYEPSAEFLKTSGGQTLAGALARGRQQAIEFLKTSGTDDVITSALVIYQNTGLFLTKRSGEDKDLAELSALLTCSMGWKRKIRYSHKQEFKTDYEEGTVEEETELTLESDSGDYLKAQWSGPWYYRYKGREGTAEGVSRATMRFQKGEYSGTVTVTPSKLSSAGRFNFPSNLSGDKRVAESAGTGINPVLTMSGKVLELTGCPEISEEDEKEKPAPGSRLGKVLLS